MSILIPYLDKSYLKEFISTTSQGGEGFLGDLTKQLFRVNLEIVIVWSEVLNTWWIEKVGVSTFAILRTFSQASSPYFT